MEDARLEKVRIVERAHCALQLGMEQLDPLAIRSLGHLPRIAAVSAEEIEVLGQVEVDRPVVAVHVICRATAVREIVTRQVEVLALDRLQVVPDRLAVESPEL